MRFAPQIATPHIAPAMCMWVLLDPTAPEKLRAFRVVQTGDDVPDGAKYIGTSEQGGFVWHLFEVPLT